MSAYPIGVEQGNKCTLTSMNDGTQYLHIFNGNHTIKIGDSIKYKNELSYLTGKTFKSHIQSVNIHNQYIRMKDGVLVSFRNLLYNV
jgi:hypothetical protein